VSEDIRLNRSRRAQLIQTGASTLTVRLEGAGKDGRGSAAPEEVWKRVEQRIHEYMAGLDIASVTLVRSKELPHPDPASGKFRQVWNDMSPSQAGVQNVGMRA
jgi:hypothetical protein